MKITIKTLQQKSHPFDVAEDETILDVKKKVNGALGHEVEQQKLIFSGKILEDAKKLSEYTVKEGDFFVLMVTKKSIPTTTTTSSAAAPSASSASSSAPSASTSAPTTSSAAVKPKSPKKETAPASTGASVSGTASVGGGGLLMGPAYESAVSNMVEMGFDRPSVEAAMKAAFNNPDRAVEYLMTGIPESATAGAALAGAEGEEGGGGDEDDQDMVDADPDSAMAALNANPQFAQLRQLIRQQPQLLEPLLQQLGQSNPQLLQMIGSNPDAFMQWLEGSGDVPQAAGAQSNVVTLTPAEMEAVNRLMALGFDRNQVIEAYLACDKNEELAANYLFDSMQ